jgi:hypothetical protein
MLFWTRGIGMRSLRVGGSLLGLTLLLAWWAAPVDAHHTSEEPDWLDVKSVITGTMEAVTDAASLSSRKGHGTMKADFEDGDWTWRASSSGTCDEVAIEIIATYPPRPGDWASARAVVVPDDPMQNFCLPGTRPFHGTGHLTGGGGNYADSQGEFALKGIVVGDGPTTTEAVRAEMAGRLRCYHVGSIEDRAEKHHH